MARIVKCIDSRHHEPCEFSEEHYVADGGAKEVNARVCLSLTTPLPLVTTIWQNECTGIDRSFFMQCIINQK